MTRRRFLRGSIFVAGGLISYFALGCATQEREFLTTLDRTIVLQGDGALKYGSGEPYEIRTDLAEAQVNRETRRRSLVVFHHFADVQLVDEESPLRGEWVDSCPEPLSKGAFRPQEALGVQVTACLIRQANKIDRSPLTGRPVDFLLHSGNAADNAQYNELRWFIDLMDGKPVQPDSGNPGYEGVQNESPDPRYPNLLGEAQRRLVGEGLRYPWYAVIGSRDVLAQGNFPPNESSQAIAVGSEKVIDLAPQPKAEVCKNPSVLLDPDLSREILNDPDTSVRTVGADAKRRLLSRRDWIAEHFNSSELPGPLGHGFSQENLDSGKGYYVLEQESVTFVVLDTVNPAGFAAGSMDRAQFRSLEEQLVARSSHYFDAQGKEVATGNPDRLIVIVSHHTSETMNNPLADPETNEERVGGKELEALLHRFPNVILHVAGHSHVNRTVPRPDPLRQTQGYWEVSTSSQVDFPMQARLLEISANGDGTLSIFSTVYDTAAPIDAREAHDPTPEDGLNEVRLASGARQLAAQDPQIDRAAAGLAPSDRNAELLLTAPLDLPTVGAAPHQRALGRRELLRLVAPALSI